MSKPDSSEQVKFLVSCIRNNTNGRPDFTAVAKELGIVSKAAAQKRYERMLKANGVNSTQAPAKSADNSDDTPPPVTPVKRRPRRAPGGAKKKVKGVKGESDEEGIKAAGSKQAKTEEKLDSDLSDPPASDVEI